MAKKKDITAIAFVSSEKDGGMIYAILGILMFPFIVLYYPFKLIHELILSYRNTPAVLEEKARAHTMQLYEETVARSGTPPTEKDFIISTLAPISSGLPDGLIDPLTDVVGGLYEEESVGQRVPPPPAVCNSIEGARYRDMLSRYSAQTTNPRALELTKETIRSAIRDFSRRLPAMPEGEASLAVPVEKLVSDLPRAVTRLIAHFFQPEVIELQLFPKLRQQLLANGDKISKGKGMILPDEYKGENLLEDYLNNTPLIELFNACLPFSIERRLRYEGVWCVAPPGRGKTTLLHSQFFDDLKTGASIIVMDSKGDFIDPLRRLDFAQIAPNRPVCILDPDPNHPLALNPLDIVEKDTDPLAVYRTITLLEGLFATLLDAKLTPLQSTLLNSVLTLLIEGIAHPTLSTFRDILQNGYTPYHDEVEHLKDEDVRTFFTKGQYDSNTYRETKQQVLWRLRHIMKNPVIKAMFNAKETTVKMGDLMDSGAIVLINANKALLGDEGAEFYQRFFITLILAAAQQRAKLAEKQKHPAYLYIDECQSAISRETKIATILQECRSQKIGLTLAHQEIQQIKSPDVLGALSNCAIRYANSDEEAPQLASRMRTTPQHLRSLGVGQFALFVRDRTDTALTVDVPYVRPASFPQLSPEGQAAQRTRMREEYSYIPTATPATTAFDVDPDNVDMSAA